MNKRTNTVLFLIGATVFNLLVMFALIVVLLVAIGALFRDSLSPNLMAILMVVIFIGSIAASFLIYSRVIKWLSRKVDMDKYFMPIFKRSRGAPKSYPRSGPPER
jgi:cytochrome c biogenesis protein CcdA